MVGGHNLPRHCPACLAEIRQADWVLPRIAVATFPTSRPRKSETLRLAHCATCGHYHQPQPDGELLDFIYRHAYAESPFQPGDYNEAPYTGPFSDIFRAHADTAPGRELLEVGCGDPKRLLPFAEQGYSCVGVDPSPPAEGASPHPRIAIIRGYMETTAFSSSFDVILMRFCLEHIVDLESLITRCHTLLRPEGLLFIQIPNNEFNMLNRPPFFGAHEHVHYFTKQSLDALLARHGFALAGGNGHREPSLIGVYRKGRDWARLHQDFLSIGAGLEKEIRVFLDAHPNPIFYGWGMTFLWMMSRFDLSLCKGAVVDDTVLFHGKSVPGTGLRVIGLSQVRADAEQAFLICASPIYHERMRAKVRERFPDAKVYGVTREGICLLS